MRVQVAVTVMRTIVAAVLATSAGLKAMDVTIYASQPDAWKIVATVAEGMGALAIISGMAPRVSWIYSELLFAVFAPASMWSLFNGESDCGCFGPFETHPLFSMLLSVSMLCALVALRRPVLSMDDRVGVGVGVGRMFLAICTFVAALLLVASKRTVVVSAKQLEGSQEHSMKRVMVLRPETWIGKEFPLRKKVVSAADLAEGRWAVVLHRAGCSRCEAVIPKYETVARDMRVALLAVDGPSDTVRSPGDAIERAYLKQDQTWIVTPPVELILNNGVVEYVAADKLPSREILDFFR